jgi:hypothetical protein
MLIIISLNLSIIALLYCFSGHESLRAMAVRSIIVDAAVIVAATCLACSCRPLRLQSAADDNEHWRTRFW